MCRDIPQQRLLHIQCFGSKEDPHSWCCYLLRGQQRARRPRTQARAVATWCETLSELWCSSMTCSSPLLPHVWPDQ